MEKDETIKKKRSKIDNIMPTMSIVFMLLATHIFILPNDILDKLPFLISYTEFMKETFPMVYQISIRVTNFPQSGALWAANMMVLTIIFIVLFLYIAYQQPLNPEFKKDNNPLVMMVVILFIFFFIKYFIDRVSIGSIFDTQLRGEPNPNAINNKFGLFFKAGMFYLFFFLFISAFIGNVAIFISMIFKKIKLKFKGLDNEK